MIGSAVKTVTMIPVWLVAIGLLGVGYVGYRQVVPAPGSVPGSAGDAVEVAVTQIVGNLEAPDRPEKLFVAPISGDRSDAHLRTEIASGIAKSVKFEVAEVEPSGRKLAAPLSLKDAARMARREKADVVLLAEASVFRQQDPVELKLDWQLIDAEDEVPLDKGSIALDEADVQAAQGPGFGSILKSAAWRLVAWVIGVAMLPLSLAGFLQKRLDQESNQVNLLVLVGLIASDLLFALALMGFQLFGVLEAIMLLVATGLAGTWNYYILARLEDFRVQS